MGAITGMIAPSEPLSALSLVPSSGTWSGGLTIVESPSSGPHEGSWSVMTSVRAGVVNLSVLLVWSSKVAFVVSHEAGALAAAVSIPVL